LHRSGSHFPGCYTEKESPCAGLFFWEFARTSWQYDIVVALILAFIFLTPKAFFKDQPRAVSVVQIPAHPANPSS